MFILEYFFTGPLPLEVVFFPWVVTPLKEVFTSMLTGHVGSVCHCLAHEFGLMLCHFSRFASASFRFHVFSWQRCFAATADLIKWQRRCARLTRLQRRISYPPMKSITVGDETYKLPLKTVGPPKEQPTQEGLEYLVGFFDGDGCVTMRTQDGQIALRITQNVDSMKVLLHFQACLGGGIAVERQRTGTQKACLYWHVTGPNMRHAAALLGQVPSMKQAQLLIGARTIAKTRHAEFLERLAQMKQSEYCPKRLKCTWAYFAGFFDAEGSIHVNAYGQIQLQLGQVNPFVLKQLLSFLHQRGLEKLRFSEGKNSSKLRCCHQPTSIKTLEFLLHSGLLVKKLQAELAMTINRDNSRHVREAIFGLNGWQARYSRLDEGGIERAKKIEALRAQLCRTSCPQNKELLWDKIQDLQEAHVFQKLVSKCHLLRKDIRNSLGEGAFVRPL